MSDGENNSSFVDWILSPKMLVSLSAVILSLCGLFVSIYETSLIRQQQYAAAWPNVEIGPSFDSNDYTLNIYAQNTGVGPAQIKSASLSYNEEKLSNWSELLNSIGGDLSEMTTSMSLINGRVLPPDSDEESIFFLRADTTKEQKDIYLTLQNEILDGNINISVCYCSVYEECWTSDMQTLLKRYRGEKVSTKNPQKIESCRDLDTSGI